MRYCKPALLFVAAAHFVLTCKYTCSAVTRTALRERWRLLFPILRIEWKSMRGAMFLVRDFLTGYVGEKGLL